MLRLDQGWVAGREPRAKRILGVIHGRAAKTGRLLEIGCGLGIMTSVFSENSRLTVGIDHDLNFLTFAHRHYKERAAFIAADAQFLPFRSSFFDIAIANYVLEYLSSNKQIQAMREIRRVLAMDGWCYLSIPNPLHYLMRRAYAPLLGVPHGPAPGRHALSARIQLKYHSSMFRIHDVTLDLAARQQLPRLMLRIMKGKGMIQILSPSWAFLLQRDGNEDQLGIGSEPREQ